MRFPSGEVKASMGVSRGHSYKMGGLHQSGSPNVSVEQRCPLSDACLAPMLTKINLEMPRPKNLELTCYFSALTPPRGLVDKDPLYPRDFLSRPRLPTPPLLAHCLPCSLGSGRTVLDVEPCPCQYSSCHQPVVLENKRPGLSALFLPISLKYHCSLVARFHQCPITICPHLSQL